MYIIQKIYILFHCLKIISEVRKLQKNTKYGVKVGLYKPCLVTANW